NKFSARYASAAIVNRGWIGCAGIDPRRSRGCEAVRCFAVRKIRRRPRTPRPRGFFVRFPRSRDMSNDEDGRPTENVQVVSNPNWYVQPTAGGTLFQIQHPEFGWLA